MSTFFELPLANDFPYFVVNSSGASVPASGFKLFLYQSGTTIKITSYTDSTGGTPNANPVLLGSTGLPQSGNNVVGIWLAQGQTVKAVFSPSTDTDPPTSPIWTRDFGANPPGINDPTQNVLINSEWVLGTTPTFISSTSFSVTGDQTSLYQVGRRVKTVNSGGTVYSSITVSSFGSGITTVTVANDSGVLDSGLTVVSYALLASVHQSLPIRTGTWTPSIGGSATYTTQSGFWVKIGSFVFANAVLTINAVGTGSTTTVSGLPFANAQGFIQSGTVSSFASIASSVVLLSCGVDASASTVSFGSLTAAAASIASNAIFKNSASVTFSVFYQTSLP